MIFYDIGIVAPTGGVNEAQYAALVCHLELLAKCVGESGKIRLRMAAPDLRKPSELSPSLRNICYKPKVEIKELKAYPGYPSSAEWIYRQLCPADEVWCFVPYLGATSRPGKVYAMGGGARRFKQIAPWVIPPVKEQAAKPKKAKRKEKRWKEFNW